MNDQLAEVSLLQVAIFSSLAGIGAFFIFWGLELDEIDVYAVKHHVIALTLNLYD
jgi:hypothetical protein